MRRAAGMLLLGLALALAAPALAAAACPRTSVGDVEDEVMCPVCGTPLNLATEAPQAQRQRAFILRLVDQCKSKDEIKTALAAQFGDRVLAVPEDEGFGRAAYLVPALAGAAGLAAVAFAAVTWRRRRPLGAPAGTAAGPAPGEPTPDDESARLDADLRRYDL